MAAPRQVNFVVGAVDRTRRVFNRIGRSARNLTRGLLNIRTVVGGLIAGQAVRSLANFASKLEGINDTADSLKLTTEQFQALKFAAEEVGVSGRDVETVMQRITRRAGEAVDGNDQLLLKFESLGITLDDLKKADPLDLFDKLTGALKRLGGVGEAKIAGIADTEGLRFFKRFITEFDGFADALAKAKAAGAIIDPKTLDDLEKAAETFRKVQRQLTVEFAPVLSEFAKAIVPVIPDLVVALKAMSHAIIEALPTFKAIVHSFTSGDALAPFKAAQDAGAGVRESFAQGRGTAGGRLIQDGIDAVIELNEIARRQESRANRGDDAVYGS